LAKRRVWIGLAAFVVALFACGYFASPLFAFSALKSAARAGDKDRLAQLVDFPAVRENLKSDIAGAMARSVGDDPKLKDNALARLGAALLPAITDRVVDNLVTPDGIAAMVRDGRQQPADADSQPAGPSQPKPKVLTHVGYDGLNLFRVTIVRADQPDAPLVMVLARQGLFGWKLTRIDLPTALAPSDPANA